METGRAIRRVLLITMGLNALATAIKLAVGLWAGSLSIVADGLDTLFDAASNIIGVIAITAAYRPPDSEHPYGHRKFEPIAALVIAFLLFLTAWEVTKQAWERLWTPDAPVIATWHLAAVAVGIGVQAATAVYERRRGRALDSAILLADARHTAANVVASLAVLAGAALVRLGFPLADPVLAFGIALLITKIGIDILRENVPTLTDRAAVPAERIAAVAQEVPGVEFVHAVRSRGPATAASVDLHIHVPRRTALGAADRIGDEVRDRLMHDVEGVQDVVVHVEPRPIPQSASEDVFAVVQEIASELSLTLHEATAYHVDGRLYVEMDVGVPRDLALGEAHRLISQLEKQALEHLPQVANFHTHIELASNEITQGYAATPESRRQVMREVGALTEKVDGVYDIHNVTVREGKDGQLYLAMDVTLDARATVEEAHRISQDIEKRLHERLPNLARALVHAEPPGAPLP